MDDFDNLGTLIKWLDIGGGGRVRVSHKSYLKELRFRRSKGWDIPKWSELPVYFNRGKYTE